MGRDGAPIGHMLIWSPHGRLARIRGWEWLFIGARLMFGLGSSPCIIHPSRFRSRAQRRILRRARKRRRLCPKHLRLSMIPRRTISSRGRRTASWSSSRTSRKCPRKSFRNTSNTTILRPLSASSTFMAFTRCVLAPLLTSLVSLAARVASMRAEPSSAGQTMSFYHGSSPQHHGTPCSCRAHACGRLGSGLDVRYRH